MVDICIKKVDFYKIQKISKKWGQKMNNTKVPQQKTAIEDLNSEEF